MNELTSLISQSLREHDPLDPWLTESHWDLQYWDAEAAAIATKVPSARSLSEVREIIVVELRRSLPNAVEDEGTDAWRTESFDAVADDVWRFLQASN